MSTSLFQIANSNYFGSGSIGFGTVVSKFGRVAGRSGVTIEPNTDIANIYLTARYATMSLYNPSLVVIPSAISSSTLFSLYASSGSAGDFTVTNNGSGSFVNRFGYIETGSSSRVNLARLDYYSGSATAALYPSLLIEPAATNLFFSSSNILGNAWSRDLVTSSSNTIDPSNTTTAVHFIPTSSGVHFVCSQSFTVGTAGTQSFSVFVRPSGSNFIQLALSNSFANFQLTGTGSVVGGANTSSVSISPYANSFYRCVLTPNFTSSAGSHQAAIYLITSSGATFAQSWDAPGVGSGSAIWGPQVESGIFPTSYIPTTTAAVTRNAEVVSVTGAVSGSIGQASGTIYAEVDIRNAFAGTFISLDIGSGADFLIIGRTSGLAVIVQLRRSNGSVVNIITSSAVALGVHKIALGYTNGDYALYIDGVSAGTSTNSTDYPSAALTRCGLAVTSYNIFNDRIRAAALYTTRLTNAELAALTSTSSISI